MVWAFAMASGNPGDGSADTGGDGSCTQVEELWLEAQSVPSASLVPCVRAFPRGVDGALRVRDGASVIKLSYASVNININVSDQPQARAEAGSVTIRLAAACDLRTAGQGQVVAPGVSRFEVGGSRGVPEAADVFPGGCVTYRAGDGTAASAALLNQAKRAVTLRTRDDLRETLRRRSGGRLELDP
jgi:hypothetical protein